MSTGMAPEDADLVASGSARWLSLAEKVRSGATPGKAPHWKAVQRVDDTDPARAAAQAQKDIEGGATGLSLVFEGAPNAFGYGLPATQSALEMVLENVPLNRTYLRADAHPASRAMADWLVAHLTQRRVDPAKLNLSFGIDPAAIFAGTGRLSMSIEALQASMPQSLAHFFALGVPGVLLECDGRVFHNAGATAAQELGAMLAAATAHLRLFAEARQALIYATPHIGFALSVDDDHDLSTAKLKALRRLWSRIQEEMQIPPSATTVHAETSYRMLSARNPASNVMRGMVACAAAVAGGADSISVLPWTTPNGLPADRAHQFARDTHMILAAENRAEASSGKTGVDALSEAAWREYQAIEKEGGLLASLAKGRIQSRVLEARSWLKPGTRNEASQDSAGFSVGKVDTLAADRRLPPADGAVFCERLDAGLIEQWAAGRA